MPKKSVQVRISESLAAKVGIIASALRKSVPDYVEEVLAAAAARDLPRAIKIAEDFAKQPKPPKTGGGE